MNKVQLAAAICAGLIVTSPVRSAEFDDQTRNAVGLPASARLGGNTGSAAYSVPFALSPARGRYQPSLSLDYSSDGGWGEGGKGWAMSLSYLEENTRAARDPATGGPRHQMWLTLNGSRTLLVKVGSQNVNYNAGTMYIYVPEASSGFTRVLLDPSSSGRALAWDGAGTVYDFGAVFGARRYLKTVTDVNGNVTQYTYDTQSYEAPRLRRVDYNYYTGGSGSVPASSVLLTYLPPGASVPPLILISGTSVMANAPLLDNVVIARNVPGFANSGVVELSRYSFNYLSEGGSNPSRIQVASVSTTGEAGAPNMVPRVTSFGYASEEAIQVNDAAMLPGFSDPNYVLTATSTRAVLCQAWFGTDTCSPLAAAVYMDLDGDHRPDRVWVVGGGQLAWQRNQTDISQPPAGNPAVPGVTFADVEILVGSTGVGHLNPSNPVADDGGASARLLDVNGDGRPDLVATYDLSTCPSGGLAIRLATPYVLGSGIFFAPPVCMDTSALGSILGSASDSDLIDMNGDGVVDYLVVNAGQWYVYPGYADAGGTLRFGAAGGAWPGVLPGAATTIRAGPIGHGGKSGGGSQDLLDVNGDGLPDLIVVDGNENWRVAYNSGAGFFRNPYTTDVDFPGRGPIDGVFNQDVTRDHWLDSLSKTGTSSCQWSYTTGLGNGGQGALGCIARPTCASGLCVTDPSTYDTRSVVWVHDTFHGNPPEADGNPQVYGYNAQWIDLDGDGLLDYVVTEANGQTVWYHGHSSSSGLPNDPYPAYSPPPGTLTAVVSPTLVSTNYWWAPSLRYDTTPLGVFKAVLRMSTTTGLDGVPMPATYYGYREAATSSGAAQFVSWAWDESTRIDQLGFRETYAIIGTAGNRWVHTSWNSSRALAGHADLVETSLASEMVTSGVSSFLTWLGGATSIGGQAVYERERRTGWACHLDLTSSSKIALSGAGCDGSPSASEYPVLVVDRRTQRDLIENDIFTSVQEVTSIDIAGNILATSSTPDINVSQLASFGDRRTHSVMSYPAVPLFAQEVQAGPIPASCKSCLLESTVYSSSGTMLSDSNFAYDAAPGQFDPSASGPRVTKGNLNFVEQLVGMKDGGLVYEIASKTAYAFDGLPVQTLQFMPNQCEPVVLTTISYDSYRLGVLSRTTSDSHSAMVVDYTIDSRTGRSIASTYPHAVGQVGTLNLAVAFDGWGRPAAIGQSVQLSGDFLTSGNYSVSGLLSSSSFDDASALSGFILARFMASTTASMYARDPGLVADKWGTLNGSFDTNSSDVSITIAYRDEFGRPVYAARRLGGSGTSGGANIVESLSGWLVTSLTAYDNVGNPWLTLDPFFFTGSLPTSAPSALHMSGSSVPLAHLTQRDGRQRISCQTTRAGGSNAALDGVCDSSNAFDSNYKQSVRFAYGSACFSSDNTKFLTSSSMPTWKSGIPATNYLDASGTVLMSMDADQISRHETVVDFDEGSEAAITYAGASRGNSLTRIKTWHDRKGRATRQADDSSTGAGYSPSARVRVQQYLPGGQLASTGMNPVSSSDFVGAVGTQYLFGSLGRLTTQVEGAAAVVQRVTHFSYDAPYNAPNGFSAYSNTFGRLASAATCEATPSIPCTGTNYTTTAVAFGYDTRGRLVLRDQWFGATQDGGPGLGSAPQSLGMTYGYDGRLLRTAATSTALSTQWDQFYDSVGHVKRVQEVAINPTIYWESQSSGGFGSYDALGRPTLILKDNAHLLEKHTYDSISGLETALGSWVATNGAVFSSTGSTTSTPNPLYDGQSLSYSGPQLAGLTENVGATAFNYTYDNNGRLQVATAASTTTTPPTLGQAFSETYRFSASGLGSDSLWLLSQVTRPGAVAGSDAYAYSSGGSQDELTSLSGPLFGSGASVTMDGQHRGLVVNAPMGELGTVSQVALSYDASNRLVGINGTEEQLGYDGFGGLARRAMGSKVKYLVGESMTVQAVSGNSITAWIHISVAGVRVASIVGGASNGQVFYHRDRTDSVVATSVDSGAQAAAVGMQYRYDPYGMLSSAIASETDANSSEQGYTGGIRLSRGLVHLNARAYSPALRAFVQPDNVDSRRYSYVGGDPINASDPSGHMMFMLTQRPYGLHIGLEREGGSDLFMNQMGGGDLPSWGWHWEELEDSHFSCTNHGDASGGCADPATAAEIMNTPYPAKQYVEVYGVGQPGAIGDMVPLYGDGRSLIDHIQNGEWDLAVIRGIMLASGYGEIKAALLALKGATKILLLHSAAIAFTRSNYREMFEKALGKIASGDVLHHMLPQQFEEEFEKLSINIHSPEFLAPVSETYHTLIHSMGYNPMWEQFFSRPRTQEEALEFGRQMAGAFGLPVRW